MTKQRTVLGLSAGSGISLFPFKESCSIIGNIELRTDFRIGGKPLQFKLNFPKALAGTSPTGYLELPDSPDIIMSQPKCGNSSVLALSRGKKKTSHLGDPSLDLVLRGINHLLPKVFLIENLPDLLKTYSKEDLQEHFNLYRLNFIIGSVSLFGNSQLTRKRLVITGVLKSIKHSKRIHAALQYPTRVREIQNTQSLLENAPTNGAFIPPINEQIAIYGGRQMIYLEIQQYWQDNPFASRWVTPEENFSTAPGVYRDLPNKPPLTIRKSNRCFNPQGYTYSPRERARIQGIPDNFLICDPEMYPNLSPKTLFNKGCAAVTQGPPYEIGLWFFKTLRAVNFIKLPRKQQDRLS